MATLDDALTMATELERELAQINLLGLDENQRPLVSDAIDMTAAVRNRIQGAIEIDDALHPEER